MAGLTKRILRLKTRHTQRAIAKRLSVSVATVKRHASTNTDRSVLDFTKKLENLQSKAPTPTVKKEIRRTIYRIRKSNHRTLYKPFYPIILKCLEDGCLELSDFKIDTGLSRQLLRKMLIEMEHNKLIKSRKDSANSQAKWFKV